MSRALLLRFDAPLMSFGGVAIDSRRVTARWPGLSMIAGLIANALGYSHGDSGRLAALQSRLRIGARCDRAGAPWSDYQTVDLGQPSLVGTGWTTRGALEGRDGASSEQTHIRIREFIADAVYTVAIVLSDNAAPSLDEIRAALDAPERPLFLGRKACLPSAPIVVGVVDADGVLDALERAPRVARGDHGGLGVWWPVDEPNRENARTVAVTDERDWWNQIHVGRRFMNEGTIDPPGVSP